MRRVLCSATNARWKGSGMSGWNMACLQICFWWQLLTPEEDINLWFCTGKSLFCCVLLWCHVSWLSRRLCGCVVHCAVCSMLYAIWCVPVSKGNKVRLSLGIICAEQFCCMAWMGSYSGCDAVLVYFLLLDMTYCVHSLATTAMWMSSGGVLDWTGGGCL